MKFLFFLGLLWLVWIIRSQHLRQNREQCADPSPAEERMLACQHCGVYVPESACVVEGGRHYCCDAHRQLSAGASSS
jgi:uncharacterized protein